jgi:hypothetical protein
VKNGGINGGIDGACDVLLHVVLCAWSTMGEGGTRKVEKVERGKGKIINTKTGRQ